MAKYHVELSGKLTLSQQSLAIDGEEALGSKFVRSQIWVNSTNVLTNLVEFDELDTAPVPMLGAPRLSKILPAGATPDWVGPMIVQGSAVPEVFLLRI